MRHQQYIRFLAAAGLAGLLTLTPAQEALAVTYGWNNNNGNYTYIEDNGSVHKGWIHTCLLYTSRCV